MGLTALRDNIIVKLILTEKEGKIIIPKTATKFKQYDAPVYGEVISVGPKHKLGAQVGDKLIFQRHEGLKFKYQGETYLKLKQRWVLGIMKGDLE